MYRAFVNVKTAGRRNSNLLIWNHGSRLITFANPQRPRDVPTQPEPHDAAGVPGRIGRGQHPTGQTS